MSISQNILNIESFGFILATIFCLNIILIHDEWFQLYNKFSSSFFTYKYKTKLTESVEETSKQRASKRQQHYGGLYFNAMVDLDELFTVDTFSIAQIREQYIQPELARIEQISKTVEEYANQISHYSTATLNPLSSYLLVKKLIKQWEIISLLATANDSRLGKFVANKFITTRKINSVKYPENEDLMAAAVAILRFQETYEMETEDLIREYGGKENFIVESHEMSELKENLLLSLSAEDCFEIGLIAYKLKRHFYTLEWMQAAFDRLQLQSNDASDLNLKIFEYLAYAHYEQGNLDKALRAAEKLTELAPSNHSSADEWRQNLKLYRKKLSESKDAANSKDSAEANNSIQVENKVKNSEESEIIKSWERYKQLCRGQMPTHKTAGNASKLMCYLKRDKPYLKLAPLKVEIIHLEPLIVFFRQVISDKEIELVKHLATPQLSRATVLNAKGEAVYASYRITKTMWLGDDDHSIVQQLNKRIEAMTNLGMETAFKLKVFKYGIGGHYDPHYDLAVGIGNNKLYGNGNIHHAFVLNDDGKDPLDMEAKLGNRVATCLFYLSQPAKGGLTIFTELGLSITPSVNDAVFWYNMDRNGQGDLRTKHAACPVLKGDKWIFTKLINERGQEWKRPCPKKINQKGEEFVGDLTGAI